MIYKWSEGSRQNVTAQKVGDAVEDIVAMAGSITPDTLVAEARNRKSPIHNLVTWNREEAAHKWRVHQARNVLANLRVIVESNGEEIPIIAYVSVHVDNVPAYVTTATAMSEQ